MRALEEALDEGAVLSGVPKTPELGDILDDARKVVDPSGVRAEYVWSAGDLGREIIDLARDRSASLIVVE